MDLQLRGRGVVITGGASGIGRACARAFLAEGAHVALLDIDERRGAAVIAELLAENEGDAPESAVAPDAGPGDAPTPSKSAATAAPMNSQALARRAIFYHADVTSEPSLAGAISAAADDLGRIDVAVGCAGISGPFGADVTEIEVADFDRVMAVNVRGQFLFAKHVADRLAQSPQPTMVLIASDSSFVAAPGMVPYNASKGAVLQLVRALSVDFEARRIRVNAVCPSIVDTPLARADLGDDGFDAAAFPIQDAEQVAAHVLYLASGVSGAVNGTSLVSDFGYLARSSFPA